MSKGQPAAHIADSGMSSGGNTDAVGGSTRDVHVRCCAADPPQDDLVREIDAYLDSRPDYSHINYGHSPQDTLRAWKFLQRARDRIVEQDKLSANYNEIKRLCDAEIAALRAQLTERVPPREPTTVMINEGVNSLRVTGGNIWDDARDVWHAMYDVAPPARPPNVEGPSKEEIEGALIGLEDYEIGDELDIAAYHSLIERLAAQLAAILEATNETERDDAIIAARKQ